jgi:hypothetical protein
MGTSPSCTPSFSPTFKRMKPAPADGPSSTLAIACCWVTSGRGPHRVLPADDWSRSAQPMTCGLEVMFDQLGAGPRLAYAARVRADPSGGGYGLREPVGRPTP